MRVATPNAESVSTAERLAPGAARPEVAVIIPTKDRPELLDEAISSALKQSHAPAEIIVVDDGSSRAVDGTELSARHGAEVRVLRNASSRGLAFSRNRGVEEARAEFVIHLDDDDLLAPEAIETCLAVFDSFPDVELTMFAAEGFGPNAGYFNRVQPAGNQRVVALAGGVEAQSGTVLFDQRLFPALLQTVPIAFQRVMLKRDTWTRVSELRWQVYCLDTAIVDAEAAKLAISGPLRDSEWARYAAIACNKTALVTKPLYLQRCAGQGYSSLPANRQLHASQALSTLEYLAQGAQRLEPIARWQPQITNALARGYFDNAYNQSRAGKHKDAWRLLLKAAMTRPQLRQARLAARVLLAPLLWADDKN